MATISLNDAAPKTDEPIRFALAHTEFELAAGSTVETDDPEAISNAETHPWLAVETPAPEPTNEVNAVEVVPTQAPAHDVDVFPENTPLTTDEVEPVEQTDAPGVVQADPKDSE